MLLFICGMTVGVIVGFFVAAMCRAAADDPSIDAFEQEAGLVHTTEPTSLATLANWPEEQPVSAEVRESFLRSKGAATYKASSKL